MRPECCTAAAVFPVPQTVTVVRLRLLQLCLMSSQSVVQLVGVTGRQTDMWLDSVPVGGADSRASNRHSVNVAVEFFGF